MMSRIDLCVEVVVNFPKKPLFSCADHDISCKTSTPSNWGGVSDVSPLYRNFMKSLGALYTHTYISVMFTTDT